MSQPSLEKLTEEWYAKLKESGFKDIESKNGTMSRGGHGGPNTDNLVQCQIDAIESYYSMARSFLLEHEFKDDLEKIIWEHHSEGESCLDISNLLKSTKVKKLKKSQVFNKIKALEAKMKEKYLVR